MAKDNIDSIEAFLSTVSDAIPDEATQSKVLKLVDGFLKQNIDGLKSKNAELISENKKLKSSVPEGLDSESIKGMLEELKGKSLDDYGNSIRQESESILNDLSTQLSESELQRQKLDSEYQTTLINLELRAAAERARVRPDAIDDFVTVHGRNFQIKDGQAISGEASPTDYVAGVLEKSNYWYPPSVGTDARGSRARHSGLDRGDGFALEAAAQSGNHAEYRKLREEKKAG